MNGEITYVSKPTESKKNGSVFFVVSFLMEDGKKAQTFVTKGLNNFARWEPLLVEGTKVGGLKLKKPGLINADSPVVKI